jgi:hypothetical protein
LVFAAEGVAMSEQVKSVGWVSSLVSFFKRLGVWLHELTNSDFLRPRGWQLSKHVKKPDWMSSLINIFKRLDAELHELAAVLVSIMLTVTKMAILFRWLVTHI